MAVGREVVKAQYLQTSRASQIDSIGVNLFRLQSLTANGIEKTVAYDLVRESQFFLEWFIPNINLETSIDFATELLSLQRQLSQCKLDWVELWKSDSQRQKVSSIAKDWGKQLRGQSKAIAQPSYSQTQAP